MALNKTDSRVPIVVMAVLIENLLITDPPSLIKSLQSDIHLLLYLNVPSELMGCIVVQEHDILPSA